MAKHFHQIGFPNRVPMNGTEKFDMVPTLIQSHRMARFYNFKSEPSISREIRNSTGLSDPFVIAPLVAGLAGITLTIIIILSIWILKKSGRGVNYTRNSEHKIIAVSPDVEQPEPAKEQDSRIIIPSARWSRKFFGKETSV